MSEPPPEAVKQADGSWILAQEDGSTMRWTRRPNGTWRRPEHRKAGWVGELEQPKYVSKGAEIERARDAQAQAALGHIPGLPPGADPGNTTQSKAQKRNERKKEIRKEKAEDFETKRIAGTLNSRQGSDNYDAEDEVPSQPPPPSNWEDSAADGSSQAAQAEASRSKSIKALEKKLRQIADLEQRRAHGEALNEDQLAKLQAKPALEAELRALGEGEINHGTADLEKKLEHMSVEPPAAAGVAAPIVVPADTAATPAPAAAAIDGPKAAKALEKKLRQITDLEERLAKGEDLNEDQLAKIASKAQIEEQLRG